VQKLLIFLLPACLLLFSACATKESAAQTVETYLKALIAKDANSLSALSCADWEAQALLELDSFQGVEASLSDLACSVTGTDGDTSLVTCQGKIIASYNGEAQEISLSDRTYQVNSQSGESLVCGYR